MEDDAGLTLMGRSVRSDDGVSTTDRVTSSYKDIQDVHTPGPASPDHQFLYGMYSLFEWHNDANTVGQLGSPSCDHSWIKTIHHCSLENSDTNALRDDYSDLITEYGSDMILKMLII